MKDGEFGYLIPADLIAKENRDRADDIDRDYESLRESLGRAAVLSRLGLDLDQITDLVAKFEAAIPSLSLGGATAGAPSSVYERLVDAHTVHSLSGATPLVTPHFAFDRVDDPMEVREFARRLGMGFGFLCVGPSPERPGERPSPGIDRLSRGDPSVRAQAVEWVHSSIEFGRALGSEGLAIGIGDAGALPGQVHLRRSLERFQDGVGEVCRALPKDWRLLLAPRSLDPALPLSAPADWGTTLLVAQALGERAFCLVDLGGPSPGSRREMVVARHIEQGKLGGIRFLETRPAGAMDPFQLFLLFSELVDAEGDSDVGKDLFRPVYTIGWSAGSGDPIEELLQTVDAVLGAYAKALLVDRATLGRVQDRSDLTSAEGLLRRAFETDVRPILRRARVKKGAAADPIEVYRGARYREEKARERKKESPSLARRA